jgi:hypothetical protein
MAKANKVISHLKKDIAADKGLLKYEEHKKSEKKHHKKKDSKKSISKKKNKGRAKIKKVMEEFKMGELHSGSKKGPIVTNPKQGIAIAISEARKKGAKIPKKRK